jgi:hypothetical protein
VAISELLGNAGGIEDEIKQKLRERLVAITDFFARGLFHGNSDLSTAALDAVGTLNQRALSSGWFKPMPSPLQPAKIDIREMRGDRALLNTSLWLDSHKGVQMSSPQVSQLANRGSAPVELSGMIELLKYASNVDAEFRQISYDEEAAFLLIDGLTAVSALIPAVVIALGGAVSVAQLADLNEFLRILLRIKYCEQPATGSLYEYIVYGIIPDGSVQTRDLAQTERAIHQNCQLLQCIAFIATSSPSDVGERLKIFQDELMLIAVRAIEATMLNYRACMAAHLKTGSVLDQQSLHIALNDLEAMEEAILVAINNPLEGRQGFGFGDVLQAVRAVRESYVKSALLSLSDDELAARVDEVMAVEHTGPYADQLLEVSARLQERMKAHLGVKAGEASGQLQSLSQGESIIPIVQYAKQMLTIIKADPGSEASATLKRSIGDTLLDMLRVFEDYYIGEISLASKQGASVDDVYRALEALHHLILEAGYARDELSPYAEHLRELLLSKAQILAQVSPKILKRQLSAAPALLGEVVQALARELPLSENSSERSDRNSLKQRARSCIQGLRRVCIPRRVVPKFAQDAFDSLVGGRARMGEPR